jgi:hypothetical protein
VSCQLSGKGTARLTDGFNNWQIAYSAQQEWNTATDKG